MTSPSFGSCWLCKHWRGKIGRGGGKGWCKEETGREELKSEFYACEKYQSVHERKK